MVLVSRDGNDCSDAHPDPTPALLPPARLAEIREREDMSNDKTQEILQDVLNERARQVAKGRDAAHDDARTDAYWAACLARVVAKDFGSRRAWVKVATIAFAAIEANDRKHQKNLAEQRPPCPGEGWEWDAFASQWFQPGAKGPAIGRAF